MYKKKTIVGKITKNCPKHTLEPSFFTRTPFLKILDPHLICMIKNLNYEFNLTSKIGSSFVVDLLVQMYHKHLVL